MFIFLSFWEEVLFEYRIYIFISISVLVVLDIDSL